MTPSAIPRIFGSNHLGTWSAKFTSESRESSMSSRSPKVAAQSSMSSFSLNLDRLTAEFPSDADAVRRLAEFLARVAASENPHGELTAGRLYDVTHPSSQRALALILKRLIQQGILEELIRV